MKEFESLEELTKFLNQKLENLENLTMEINERSINLSYLNVVRTTILFNSLYRIDLSVIDQFVKNVERFKKIESYLPHQRQTVESQDFEDHSIYYLKCSDDLKFVINTKDKSVMIDVSLDIYVYLEDEKLSTVRLKKKSYYHDLKEIPNVIIKLVDLVSPSNLSIRNRS